MTATTLACPQCGAELLVAPHAALLVCGRSACPYVAPLPAAWEVSVAGGSRLPGFESEGEG